MNKEPILELITEYDELRTQTEIQMREIDREAAPLDYGTFLGTSLTLSKIIRDLERLFK